MKNKAFPFCKSGWQLDMMPAGYLMIEHRLIERMVRLMVQELSRMRKHNKASVAFLDKAVDFIRVYADECHHGKEEDILFYAMNKKKLAPKHRKMMDQLVKEHVLGRKSVQRLVKARELYAQGNPRALKEIKKQVKWLIEFYPKHIAKEDKGFFIPCMSYFNKRQQENMLLDFCRADGPNIQKNYREAVAKMEQQYK